MRCSNYYYFLLALACAALLTPAAAAADKLHMILVQGVTVAGASSDAMKAMMIHDDWKRLTQTGGRLVKVVQDTRQGNRDKILAAIDQFGEVGPRDVVVFYYTGHGAIDDNEGHIFQLDDGATLPRSEVRQKLQKLGGRLTILVTDCCAVVVQPRRQHAAGLDPPEVAERVAGNLGRLFAVNGLVDLNAASRDQLAWGRNNGGLFTSEFKRILSEERVDSWDAFSTALKAGTERSYGGYRDRNIAEAGRPDMLGQDDLQLVQQQESQTPDFLALDIKEDNGGGNNGGRPMLVPPLRGVVVSEVFDGTTAMKLFLNGQQMKLEAGDRILTLNGRGIRDAAHFGEIIDELGRGVAIRVAVEDTNTGKILEMTGRLDAGGGYRFGAKVNDPE